MDPKIVTIAWIVTLTVAHVIGLGIASVITEYYVAKHTKNFKLK